MPSTLVALSAGAEDGVEAQLPAAQHAAPTAPPALLHDVGSGKGAAQQADALAAPSFLSARASLHSSRREVRCCTTPSSSATLKSLYTTSLCWCSISACTAFVTAAASTLSLFDMDVHSVFLWRREESFDDRDRPPDTPEGRLQDSCSTPPYEKHICIYVNSLRDCVCR